MYRIRLIITNLKHALFVDFFQIDWKEFEVKILILSINEIMEFIHFSINPV